MYIHCTMFSWQCSSELLPANVHAEMIMWQCSCDKYVHVPMLGCSSDHHNSQIHIVILHTWRLPDAKWTCNIKSWRCSYDNVHDSSMRHESCDNSEQIMFSNIIQCSSDYHTISHERKMNIQHCHIKISKLLRPQGVKTYSSIFHRSCAI